MKVVLMLAYMFITITIFAIANKVLGTSNIVYMKSFSLVLLSWLIPIGLAIYATEKKQKIKPRRGVTYLKGN